MQLRFAGHWLAFLWEVTEPAQLAQAVHKATKADATVFELIYHALNTLSAADTAAALKKGGMTQATMCIFFPDGQDGAPPPMGDPLGDDKDFDMAVATFRDTVNFISDLQTHGININMIVGPSCWVLGKRYDMSRAEKIQRITKFYGTLKPDLLATPVKVAIELLRPSEDDVLEDMSHWVELIDALNKAQGANRFGAHWDSVHMDWRGFDLVESIKMLDHRIMHLHFNGVDRRPAGGEGDTIDWAAVITALEATGLNKLTATNEPFCQIVRDNCPPLGEGLPPAVSEPSGMIITRRTLQKYGVEILV